MRSGEEGQTFVEYALVLMLVVGLATTFGAFGTQVAALLGDLVSQAAGAF